MPSFSLTNNPEDLALDHYFEILSKYENKPTFVIGDIQGCYSEFRRLLKIIDPMKKIKSSVWEILLIEVHIQKGLWIMF